MEIKFTQTPNYTKGSGAPKIGFVLHGTLGSYNGSIGWLMTRPEDRPDRTQSSAHYVIGRNEGEVTQLVRNEDISWHAGNISNPSSRITSLLPKNPDGTFKNPNTSFIGIEFVWGYDMNGDGSITDAERTLTEWQYKCAMEIIKSSGIINPILISHKEIADYKTDDMLFAVTNITVRMTSQVPQVNKTNNQDVVKQIQTKLGEIQVLLSKIVV